MPADASATREKLIAAAEGLFATAGIEAAQPQPFTIRFHLHPNVTASLQQDNETVLLRTPSGQGFRLRALGAPISIEAVYRRARTQYGPGYRRDGTSGGLEPRRARSTPCERVSAVLASLHRPPNRPGAGGLRAGC